jgi:hypothetical protein
VDAAHRPPTHQGTRSISKSNISIGSEAPHKPSRLLGEEAGETVARGKHIVVQSKAVLQRFQSVNWKAHASPADADIDAQRTIQRTASARSCNVTSQSPICVKPQVSAERATLLQVRVLG